MLKPVFVIVKDGRFQMVLALTPIPIPPWHSDSDLDSDSTLKYGGKSWYQNKNTSFAILEIMVALTCWIDSDGLDTLVIHSRKYNHSETKYIRPLDGFHHDAAHTVMRGTSDSVRVALG